MVYFFRVLNKWVFYANAALLTSDKASGEQAFYELNKTIKSQVLGLDKVTIVIKIYIVVRGTIWRVFVRTKITEPLMSQVDKPSYAQHKD